MSKRDKALDRIRKVLARARRGGSAEEAATAAAIAAKIMAEHGITETEADAEPDVVGPNDDVYVVVSHTKSRGGWWKWLLAWCVGESGRCKPYYLHSYIGQEITATMIAYIGRRSDAQMCCYLLEYLMRELKEVHDERKPRVGKRIQSYIPGKPPETQTVTKDDQRHWSSSFWNGAVAAIDHRMQLARQQVMSEAEAAEQAARTQTQTADVTERLALDDPEKESKISKALVRLDNIAEEIKVEAKKLGITYVPTPKPTIHSHTGFHDGIFAGQQIDIATEHPGQKILTDGEDRD